ncbi:MAG TPA: LPS assembly protein LptD, partial [Thermoanaerobaculia bacterium]|nr:LPS assembly protein LptD [Thermoanaerobaculia bacterium]
FNRDFNLTSTRSVKDEAFVTMNRGPFSYNARLDREEALFGTSTVITERRPVLEARFRPTPVLGQLLFLEASAQAGELRSARPFGQPSGLYDRVDFFPKASAPLSPVPWLSIDASLGGRVTSYGKSLSENGSALDGGRYTRSLLVAGVEMTGPSFAKLFEAKIGSFTKFKHVIEPRIDWDYTSDPGTLQRAPLLDEVDSIASAHTLRYALVQRLLAKGKSGAAREIASLEIARVYSFRLPGEGTLAGPSPYVHKNGPVDATLRVNTGSSLNFDARTTWDTSANQITSASLTASFSAAERSLALSLFDSRPVGASASAQLRYSVGAPIVKKLLRLDVIGNYDLSEGRMLESRTLLTIEGSCFKILTEFRDLRIGATPSRDFRIALNLKNVGSFLDFTGSLSH